MVLLTLSMHVIIRQLSRDPEGVSENEDEVTKIIGVEITYEDASETRTCLGVVLTSSALLSSGRVNELRSELISQIPSHPSEFSFCTSQGWPLSETQEKEVKISQIITTQHSVLIKHKYEEPKIGIKDGSRAVIGFVFCCHSSKLGALRDLVFKQVVEPYSLSQDFHFVDENHWPISMVQESQMTVWDVLIGSCVTLDVRISPEKSQTQFSPPDRPPCKRLKATTRQLSFLSGKDVARVVTDELDVTDGPSKQILISYVRSEAAKHALNLKEQLSAYGLGVYLDVHEIQSGVDWQDSLNFAVSDCEVFIPLVTDKYGETQWTNREVKLADVLGKYILPINFLEEWPPKCLAIQFATTQFIPWKPVEDINASKRNGVTECLLVDNWTIQDIQRVATEVVKRVSGFPLASITSLSRRRTVVKSCVLVKESMLLAQTGDREGLPLVVVLIHPNEQKFGEEIQTYLEGEKFEVWCSTALDDSLYESQDSMCASGASLDASSIECIRTFQAKADEASVVLVILSKAFTTSCTCRKQAFYCEHRKRVVPVQYEDFVMPKWMQLLWEEGAPAILDTKQEDFRPQLLQQLKSMLGASRNSKLVGALKQLNSQHSDGSIPEASFKRKVRLTTRRSPLRFDTHGANQKSPTSMFTPSPSPSPTGPPPNLATKKTFIL